MKRHSLSIIMVSILIAGCSKHQVPVTKRNQLILLDKDEENKVSQKVLKKILKYNKLSTDEEKIKKINEIGQKIAKGLENSPIEKWEFILLKRKDINAACLADGTIIIHEGVFKVAKNDDQLAAIIAHEMAHAISRHGNAKITRTNISNTLEITGSAIAAVFNPVLIIPYLALYEGAKQPVFEHYSKLEEREADEISLHLMKKAGYKTNECVKLWRNIKHINVHRKNKKSNTHVSYNQRIKELNLLIRKNQ